MGRMKEQLIEQEEQSEPQVWNPGGEFWDWDRERLAYEVDELRAQVSMLEAERDYLQGTIKMVKRWVAKQLAN